VQQKLPKAFVASSVVQNIKKIIIYGFLKALNIKKSLISTGMTN